MQIILHLASGPAHGTGRPGRVIHATVESGAPLGRARSLDDLASKREQQVMEVIHRRGRATAADVFDALPDAPSYNAVRGVLRVLEEKGRIVHEREGRRYVYRPAIPTKRAGRAALSNLVRTFFEGSAEELLSTLLDERAPSEEELDRLQRLIDEARSGGGG